MVSEGYFVAKYKKIPIGIAYFVQFANVSALFIYMHTHIWYHQVLVWYIKHAGSLTSLNNKCTKTISRPMREDPSLSTKHHFRSSHQRCSKKISQNSQENTCPRVFLIRLQASGKRLGHRCFAVNFAKFLRTFF